MSIQFIPAVALVASGLLMFSSASLIHEHWRKMADTSGHAENPRLEEAEPAPAAKPRRTRNAAPVREDAGVFLAIEHKKDDVSGEKP